MQQKSGFCSRTFLIVLTINGQKKNDRATAAAPKSVTRKLSHLHFFMKSRILFGGIDPID